MKRIITVLLTLALLISLTACGSEGAFRLARFDEKARNAKLSESLIAQNGNYSLSWDAENYGVVLTDLKTGETWGTSPEKDAEPELDELGMPKKRHPQLESPIIVKCYNSETTTEDVLLSYTDAVKGGRVRCAKIPNGLHVEYFFDSMSIMVPVDYELLEDSVRISINPKKIQEGKNTILQVSVAPFWCSAKNDSEDSYLFIPSGSGAIVSTASRSQQGISYAAQVYGGDLSIEEVASTSKTESVKLPVFGSRADGKATLAVIEKGADSAWINALAGPKTVGYSSVYTTFQLRGYTNHIAQLFSATKVERIVYSDLVITSPLSVRYFPLSGDNADYNGMAATYKKYLTDNAGLPEKSEDKALNLNLIGGTMITKSFLGIPYQSLYPTCDIETAEEILKDFGKNTSVNLKGYGVSGIDEGEPFGGYKIDSKLGSTKDINRLSDNAKENGIDLYLNFEFVKSTDSKNSAVSVSEKKSMQYHYNKAVNDQVKNTLYYILSPAVFEESISKLIKKTDDIKVEGMSLGDISKISYSDYSDKANSKYYAKNGVSKAVSDAIKAVKKSGKKYLASSANLYAALEADIVTDAPTVSSGENIFNYDIPFYQMIFKGRIPMTTESVNLAADRNKAILSAVESGLGLNYTIISEWDNEFINSNYPIFYNSVYADIKDSIAKDTEALKDYLALVSGAEITNYSVIDKNVRKTAFDNGVSVYVNYGGTAYASPDGEVAPFGYLVKEG